jgi:hypothetical protein
MDVKPARPAPKNGFEAVQKLCTVLGGIPLGKGHLRREPRNEYRGHVFLRIEFGIRDYREECAVTELSLVQGFLSLLSVDRFLIAQIAYWLALFSLLARCRERRTRDFDIPVKLIGHDGNLPGFL